MKSLMLCLVLFMLFEVDIVRANDTAEEVKPLFDILLYCNTKEYIEQVATKQYNLTVAATGMVNDTKHKSIMDIKLLINPFNSQWAIVFSFNDINKSCLLGGNNIKLYSP